MSTAIEVDNLRKTYKDVVAIDGVSFEVRQGEIFGMVGPNGAGKTTTIECIEGLRRPDGGSVRLLGLDPAREQRQVADRIGIQPMTVLGMVLLVAVGGLLYHVRFEGNPLLVLAVVLFCAVRLLKGLWFGVAWSDMLLETAMLGATMVVCALLTARFFCWE